MKIYKSVAAAWAGSDAELARRLGVTRQAVSQWKARRPIPQNHVKTLQALDPVTFGIRGGE